MIVEIKIEVSKYATDVVIKKNGEYFKCLVIMDAELHLNEVLDTIKHSISNDTQDMKEMKLYGNH